jgi:hypothetical protein
MGGDSVRPPRRTKRLSDAGPPYGVISFLDEDYDLMVILLCIYRIVVKTGAILVEAEGFYDLLTIVGYHEIDKFGCQGLTVGGPLGLAKGVVGVDHERIAPEQDLQIG